MSKFEQNEIKVNDRRGTVSEETPILNLKKENVIQEKPVEQEKLKESQPEGFEGEGGDITLSHFVMSLASSALMQMGFIADPETKKREKNLPYARQQIEIIEMLEKRTQGNRTTQENELFTQALYELRLRFVEANKS